MSMKDVAACPRVPILLFGATLNEFQRPQSTEAHSLFTLSQYAMGCQRTDFLAAPGWLSLARCMTLSCAAIATRPQVVKVSLRLKDQDLIIIIVIVTLLLYSVCIVYI